MKTNIQQQIQNINNALAWVKKYRPGDYAQKFLQLVDYRKTLKMVAAASRDNPGIAAFGKSQVGKSYLFSCLLQGGDGEPYMIKAGDRSYNFVFDVNPPSAEGGGTESTGVVSRFSAFGRTPDEYNPSLPVLVKTFSAKDIVLIMADTYFNDLIDFDAMGEEEIRQLCDRMEERYAAREPQAHAAISADDVLAMQDYFKRHVNNGQSFRKASFFSRLALFVENIPVADYADVFAHLWHNERSLTDLFVRLMQLLESIGFADKVYLPIEAVLHEGKPENTIMSVQCLKQLLNSTSQYTTDVYVRRDGQYVKAIEGIAKSAVCAICAEVVFHIDEAFVKSSRQYCFDGMADDVKARFTQKPVQMSMLEHNDLLDFPGARTREALYTSVLVETESLLKCFLRGKVAYIFNKYNEEMRINILLFCHHNKDNDVTTLYTLLDDWVSTYVGGTPEQRAKKIEQTGLSPLFFIGTMFNLDMKLGVGEKPTPTVAETRWKNRFDNIVNEQVLHATEKSWASNWTAQGEPFRNSYVLRDFKFSDALYDGFQENRRETGMKMSGLFYDMLRSSFIESAYVQRRFADPAMAWDAAASINNDGALYIMENLQEVASRMDAARTADFDRKVQAVCNKAVQAIDGYHVSDKIEHVLEGNVQKARDVLREMDFTCNADNYYFGHLLQALQLGEADAYRTVHATMQGTEINAKVNEFRDYEIIRSSCAKAGHPIKPEMKEEEQKQCLVDTYGFASVEDADEYLKKHNVDPAKLFSGDYKRKMNSYIIGDAVYAAWCGSIHSAGFLNEYSGDNSFDSGVMNSLVDNIISTAKAVRLSDAMADAIAEYVNVVDIHTANESLLADILASIVSGFVLDLGYSRLSDGERQAAREICQQEKLPAFNYICREEKDVYTEDDLTAMFDRMSTSPMSLLPSFENTYNRWMEYMFISFVAHLEVPVCDHESNQMIEQIINQLNANA